MCGTENFLLQLTADAGTRKTQVQRSALWPWKKWFTFTWTQHVLLGTVIQFCSSAHNFSHYMDIP